MSDFVQHTGIATEFTSSESWVILSPIELSIKRKIEAVGVPLKDWDINIYRGVLTGYNDAFIISTDKRDEILANCLSEEERARTEELIRPILRGRDIKRYGYEWAGLYIIATFPSRNYDIENYPAVKKYLLSFAEDTLRKAGYGWVADTYLADFCKQKLSQTGEFVVIDGKRIRIGSSDEKARKKTSNKWFETQDSISYWDDFSKPKLFYADISQTLGFAFCDETVFCNNTTYFISCANPETLLYIAQFLNHKLYDWYYRTSSVQLGSSAVRMFSIYVLCLPVAKELKENNIYKTFGLTCDEINFIESQ